MGISAKLGTCKLDFTFAVGEIWNNKIVYQINAFPYKHTQPIHLIVEYNDLACESLWLYNVAPQRTLVLISKAQN